MIPRANITAWRKTAPWPDNTHVEQDLVISRALVEMFNQPTVAEQAIFRGGTALHKLFFSPPGRYSEDIDLVQANAGPIGPLVEGIRAVLDPWLGDPKRKAGKGRFTLSYRFESTFTPVVAMRLKVEINTREHFALYGVSSCEFGVENKWFSGTTHVATYTLSELLGTKLRALYQRKKGRDLFDLALGLAHEDFDAKGLVDAFLHDIDFGGTPITRAQFEANLAAKIVDRSFLQDVRPFLRTGVDFDSEQAWADVHKALITRLPGDPWKDVSTS